MYRARDEKKFSVLCIGMHKIELETCTNTVTLNSSFAKVSAELRLSVCKKRLICVGPVCLSPILVQPSFR